MLLLLITKLYHYVAKKANLQIFTKETRQISFKTESLNLSFDIMNIHGILQLSGITVWNTFLMTLHDNCFQIVKSSCLKNNINFHFCHKTIMYQLLPDFV